MKYINTNKTKSQKQESMSKKRTTTTIMVGKKKLKHGGKSGERPRRPS